MLRRFSWVIDAVRPNIRGVTGVTADCHPHSDSRRQFPGSCGPDNGAGLPLFPLESCRGFRSGAPWGEMAFSVCLLAYCSHCEGKMCMDIPAVFLHISEALKEENTH